MSEQSTPAVEGELITAEEWERRDSETRRPGSTLVIDQEAAIWLAVIAVIAVRRSKRKRRSRR